MKDEKRGNNWFSFMCFVLFGLDRVIESEDRKSYIIQGTVGNTSRIVETEKRDLKKALKEYGSILVYYPNSGKYEEIEIIEIRKRERSGNKAVFLGLNRSSGVKKLFTFNTKDVIYVIRN